MSTLWTTIVAATVAQDSPQEVMGYPALIDLFLRGGPVMYPILALSILGLFFWLRGALVVRAARRDLPRGRSLLTMAQQGNFRSLKDAAEAGGTLPDSIAFRVLSFTGYPASELRREAQEVMASLLYGAVGATRWVTICARLAPLLGLLGTVVGISITFSDVAATGGSGDYARLADGIHQALFTTIFGLIVALILTVLGALLNSRLVGLEHAGDRFTDALILHIKREEANDGR